MKNNLDAWAENGHNRFIESRNSNQMPKIGDTYVSVGYDYLVIVRVFKFDTIRQEAYWVTDAKRCKKCKNKIQADQYKARIEMGL